MVHCVSSARPHSRGLMWVDPWAWQGCVIGGLYGLIPVIMIHQPIRALHVLTGPGEKLSFSRAMHARDSGCPPISLLRPNPILIRQERAWEPALSFLAESILHGRMVIIPILSTKSLGAKDGGVSWIGRLLALSTCYIGFLICICLVPGLEMCCNCYYYCYDGCYCYCCYECYC